MEAHMAYVYNTPFYRIRIPVTKPLADPRAAKLAADADAIEANTRCTLQDLTRCIREVERRQLLQSLPDSMIVTDDEIAESIIRQTIVTIELSLYYYSPMPGARDTTAAQVDALTNQENETAAETGANTMLLNIEPHNIN